MFCCRTDQLTERRLGLNFSHVIPENNYKHFTNVFPIFKLLSIECNQGNTDLSDTVCMPILINYR